ncbi:adenosylmethionine--8-amino-7-oxononanoate transaminase [Lewinella sp. 4G2]|uniref:adenosylmethionine--8-amino-7-oxononanoate transaminase n=1 Tax=Lewinella sp. 4G2 TaxID=1803372 RepID=UPI0007B49C01|nr:adenosylmethionine--8-amino-7-oxononanoate transaminase [Lewinella sp. 4G2]OAV45578.1 adenosylmethionine--8-amino-7-oxononanoate transaminase [Lewinella sp. 4G2]
MTPEDLAFDRHHLWHPYTSLKDPLPTYPIVAGEGARLQLADGRWLIDGMSSWWCAVHGYNVPELNEAARAQLDKISHVMFGGLTHQPAVELGRLLVRITPEPLQRVFLADSGSVSVEVAMKMAIQYQFAKGERGRSKFLTFRGGYHGDTTGPMSVCDPETGMHGLFAGFLPTHHFIDRPLAGVEAELDQDYLAKVKRAFADHARECAAFICEPIVQGAGGMHFYNTAYLNVIRELCDEYGLLLIYDEIATGFGRTGNLFAAETTACPDVMCLGKALTGGYLTLAATLCTDHVAETIGNSEVPNLMHGPTFMGNPLACSIAVASLKLLEARDWQQEVANIRAVLNEFLSPARALAVVADVRILGAIGVIELHEAVRLAEIQAFFVEHGVWVRPFGKLVYLMPPFVIKRDDLIQLCTVLVKAVQPENQGKLYG